MKPTLEDAEDVTGGVEEAVEDAKSQRIRIDELRGDCLKNEDLEESSKSREMSETGLSLCKIYYNILPISPSLIKISQHP